LQIIFFVPSGSKGWGQIPTTIIASQYILVESQESLVFPMPVYVGFSGGNKVFFIPQVQTEPVEKVGKHGCAGTVHSGDTNWRVVA
jgi:hypothetical protein